MPDLSPEVITYAQQLKSAADGTDKERQSLLEQAHSLLLRARKWREAARLILGDDARGAKPASHVEQKVAAIIDFISRFGPSQAKPIAMHLQATEGSVKALMLHRPTQFHKVRRGGMVKWHLSAPGETPTPQPDSPRSTLISSTDLTLDGDHPHTQSLPPLPAPWSPPPFTMPAVKP